MAGAASSPHKPGCLEERKTIAQQDREVPLSAQALDRSQLEEQLEQARARELAVRVQLAAIVNLAAAATHVDRTSATLEAALRQCTARAGQAIAVLDGLTPAKDAARPA